MKTNDNEYRIDDRLYIKQIKSCKIVRRFGDTYDVRCKIIQRGCHEYRYHKGDKFIGKTIGMNKLWLDEEADELLNNTVDDFDVFADMRDGYIKIHISWLNGDVYLRHTDDYKYDFIFEYIDDNNKISCCGMKNVDLQKIIDEIIDRIFVWNFERSFYSYAKATNDIYETLIDEATLLSDDILKIQLKICKGEADKEDCRKLSELLDKRILYSLSEKYNKIFAVKADGIDERLLFESGYLIRNCQRRDWTIKAWRLNPVTKECIKGAKEDEVPITFEEYLAMFDEGDKI